MIRIIPEAVLDTVNHLPETCRIRLPSCSVVFLIQPNHATFQTKISNVGIERTGARSRPTSASPARAAIARVGVHAERYPLSQFVIFYS
jgi:hypothetical protein